MSVDDHGLEALRKSANEVTPGNKSDYYIKVREQGSGSGGSSASNTGATILKTDLGAVSEFEIVAVTGQTDVIITSLSNGKVHFSLTTGVDTTYAEIGKDDQLVLEDFNASVFVIRASGTGTIQIDQRSSI